jgi:archaellum biogenesis ATPase FlaH
MGKKTYQSPSSGEIENYLTAHGYTFKRYSSGSGHDNLKLEKAPCCGHKLSFSINHVTGQFECWHTECSKRGNWVTLRRMLNDPLPFDKQIVNFKQDWKDFFQMQQRGPVTRNKYPKVLKYLHDRGMSNETLDAFRVSNKYDTAVRFPMYAWQNGVWEMVNARIIQVIGEKKNWFDITGGPTHLMIGNHLMEESSEKTIYIFEGQWDVLTAYELGMRNVFSLPNGASSVKQEMLQYIPQDWGICICVDMDPSGDACAEKFFNMFGTRVSRIHMPYKDLNDWYKEEPSLTKEEVISRRSYMIKAREKKYRRIKRNISEAEKQRPIVETPFAGLNQLMGGGFFPAQMTSILAASGAGKTTLVNQLAVFTANKGVKIGLISLEGSERELDEKLDRTITGVVGEGSDENVLKNLLVSSLKGKYVSHAQILEECNIMVYDDRCKIVIVDNLDYITSGIDQKKYESTAALMDLTDKAKIHLIQLWQCNKNDPNKRVNSGSQKGESRIFQDSHNYISMNQRYPDGKELEMEKNREKGRGKFLINLDYDEKTNTYIEIIENNTEKQHNLKLLNLQ